MRSLHEAQLRLCMGGIAEARAESQHSTVSSSLLCYSPSSLTLRRPPDGHHKLPKRRPSILPLLLMQVSSAMSSTIARVFN